VFEEGDAHGRDGLQIVDVMTPRELYAAGATCPYCPLGDIPVNASDQPTYNPVGATDAVYHRVHNVAHADLTGATLTGTFRDWDFTGANLTRANLTKVNFMNGTRLADANFSGATLDEALFDGVDLSGANFVGARWDPARPPRFLNVQIGRSPSGKCTQFTGLDLLVAFSKFSLAPVPFCSEGGRCSRAHWFVSRRSFRTLARST
jgi:Pentapeptide repeats (8 copies)